LPIPSRTFPCEWPVTYSSMVASFVPSSGSTLPLSNASPKVGRLSSRVSGTHYTQGLASAVKTHHCTQYGMRPNTKHHSHSHTLRLATRNSKLQQRVWCGTDSVAACLMHIPSGTPVFAADVTPSLWQVSECGRVVVRQGFSSLES
jgi:hypothetical protein